METITGELVQTFTNEIYKAKTSMCVHACVSPHFHLRSGVLRSIATVETLPHGGRVGCGCTSRIIKGRDEKLCVYHPVLAS